MQLLDHISITVRDLERVKPFYLAIMSVLGAKVASERPGAIGFGKRNRPNDDVHTYLSVFESPEASSDGRRHWCFRASSIREVDKFHQVGLEAGGTSEGEPGLREYHPGYYAAFLADPEGNRVEAVYHHAEPQPQKV
jgi:catechol 2,3-dioxygenase-like lactoylglutathione lyase family enzyme